MYKPSNEYFKKILEGDIEHAKQNSLYVGLKRKKNKIDMKNRIVNPIKMIRKKAEKQINLIQKCLLELIISVNKDLWIIDSDYLDDYLTEELYKDLKTKWKIVDKNFNRKLERLEKSE